MPTGGLFGPASIPCSTGHQTASAHGHSRWPGQAHEEARQSDERLAFLVQACVAVIETTDAADAVADNPLVDRDAQPPQIVQCPIGDPDGGPAIKTIVAR